MMSGPFVLGSMPQGFFTKNPYIEDDRCITVKPRPSPPKVGPRFGIFKPSSYTKWVGLSHCIYFPRTNSKLKQLGRGTNRVASGSSAETGLRSPSSKMRSLEMVQVMHFVRPTAVEFAGITDQFPAGSKCAQYKIGAAEGSQ